MTYDMVGAVIVTFGYSRVIKVAVGRERPNGENKSFPSGHSSNAFALAAVAERHYGWRIGVPRVRHRGCRRVLAHTAGQALRERRRGRRHARVHRGPYGRAG
jgi:membrane-associated phospholipid phosphatase